MAFWSIDENTGTITTGPGVFVKVKPFSSEPPVAAIASLKMIYNVVPVYWIDWMVGAAMGYS
jgi:hypothetical protein